MAVSSKSKLDTELVRELANILRDADLGELEIEHEGTRVRVSKISATAPMAQMTMPAAYAAPAPMSAQAPTAVVPVSAPGEAAAPSAAPADAVTSPMVGTAYLSSEPGEAAFVKVGDKVEAGQTLMLVEAMKTFNPVEAPHAGTVRQILVSDAQPVEFGEPLMVIN